MCFTGTWPFVTKWMNRIPWIIEAARVDVKISISSRNGIGRRLSNNGPFLQIPQCTCLISHNALFRTEMWTFLFWMAHCGIWDKCIVGFMRLVYLFWAIGELGVLLEASPGISWWDVLSLTEWRPNEGFSHGISLYWIHVTGCMTQWPFLRASLCIWSFKLQPCHKLRSKQAVSGQLLGFASREMPGIICPPRFFWAACQNYHSIKIWHISS